MQNMNHWTEKYNPEILKRIADLINSDKTYSFIKSEMDFNSIMMDFIEFGKEVCELQKQEIAKVMEGVVYDDRIGNMSYESIEKAVMTTKNVCDI